MNTPVIDCPSSWPIHHLVRNGDACLEEMAMVNSLLWLTQAARGEVPHGGIDLTTVTKEAPVDEPIDFSSENMMPIGDGNE